MFALLFVAYSCVNSVNMVSNLGAGTMKVLSALIEGPLPPEMA